MVSSPLIRPYFLGVPLGSHDESFPCGPGRWLFARTGKIGTRQCVDRMGPQDFARSAQQPRVFARLLGSGDDIRYDSNNIQQATTADSLVLGFHNVCMMATKHVTSYSLGKDGFAHKLFLQICVGEPVE